MDFKMKIITFFYFLLIANLLYSSSFNFEERESPKNPKKTKQLELINQIDEKLKIDGNRVLLLLDVSNSNTMKDAFELELLQNECIQVINKIPKTSEFGVVVFSINLKGFAGELVSASADQKAAAEDWIKTEFKKFAGLSSRGEGVIKNPYGFAGVLEYAASLKPDTLIVLSDGNYSWKYDTRPEQIPWNEIRKFTNKKLQENGGCKISFIALQPKDDDRRQLISISSSTKGQFIEIK
jgi:hypothetical protein